MLVKFGIRKPPLRLLGQEMFTTICLNCLKTVLNPPLSVLKSLDRVTQGSPIPVAQIHTMSQRSIPVQEPSTDIDGGVTMPEMTLGGIRPSMLGPILISDSISITPSLVFTKLKSTLPSRLGPLMLTLAYGST